MGNEDLRIHYIFTDGSFRHSRLLFQKIEPIFKLFFSDFECRKCSDQWTMKFENTEIRFVPRGSRHNPDPNNPNSNNQITNRF